MRAVWYETTGAAADVLSVGDLPDPIAGSGEVLVRVIASGINPADVKRRAGWGGTTMDHSRVVPHCDGAGVIEAVGPGVSPARIGERVWIWNAQGGYGMAGRAFGTAADLIALPTQQAVQLPDILSFEAGACLGVPAMTAHRSVFADGPVDGKTILIQGGAGAVGHIAVQMARIGGATVFATVSNPEGATHAEAVGAIAIDRHKEDILSRVNELTDRTGVDRIIEVDFAANMELDIELLSANGTIASYSSSSNPSPQLPYYGFAAKGLNVRFVQGFGLSDIARADAQQFITRHAAELHIAIGAEFPLKDAVLAHQRVEQGGIGNTVLKIT